MNITSKLIAFLEKSPALARLGGIVLVAYILTTELAFGWDIISMIISTPGMLICLSIIALIALGSVGKLRRALVGPKENRGRNLIATILMFGAALSLIGIYGSIAWRTVTSFSVGEGQPFSAHGKPNLPDIKFGEITLKTEGPNFLLSRRVDIKASVNGEPSKTIGLYPPTFIGSWRLSVNRFGYAPAIDWLDVSGRPLFRGLAMIGTFPLSPEDATLVDWLPIPNVMLGVGFYPPRLEEMITPPMSDYHLFIRIISGEIAGVKRDLTASDAHLYLTDGKINNPVYFIQIFNGRQKVYEGEVKAGEVAKYPGGSISLPNQIPPWVEIIATRGPWMIMFFIGLLIMTIGSLGAATRFGYIRIRRR